MYAPNKKSSSRWSEGACVILPLSVLADSISLLSHLYFRYENPEIALNCGLMLKECIRHEPLAKIILESEDFYKFFGYVELSTFDIAADAFATFRVTPSFLLFPSPHSSSPSSPSTLSCYQLIHILVHHTPHTHLTHISHTLHITHTYDIHHTPHVYITP